MNGYSHPYASNGQYDQATGQLAFSGYPPYMNSHGMMPPVPPMTPGQYAAMNNRAGLMKAPYQLPTQKPKENKLAVGKEEVVPFDDISQIDENGLAGSDKRDVHMIAAYCALDDNIPAVEDLVFLLSSIVCVLFQGAVLLAFSKSLYTPLDSDLAKNTTVNNNWAKKGMTALDICTLLFLSSILAFTIMSELEGIEASLRIIRRIPGSHTTFFWQCVDMTFGAIFFTFYFLLSQFCNLDRLKDGCIKIGVIMGEVYTVGSGVGALLGALCVLAGPLVVCVMLIWLPLKGLQDFLVKHRVINRIVMVELTTVRLIRHFGILPWITHSFLLVGKIDGMDSKNLVLSAVAILFIIDFDDFVVRWLVTYERAPALEDAISKLQMIVPIGRRGYTPLSITWVYNCIHFLGLIITIFGVVWTEGMPMARNYAFGTQFLQDGEISYNMLDVYAEGLGNAIVVFFSVCHLIGEGYRAWRMSSVPHDASPGKYPSSVIMVAAFRDVFWGLFLSYLLKDIIYYAQESGVLGNGDLLN